MEGFGCLFQIRKDGRAGIWITVFEEMFIKCVRDLGAIEIIHGPNVQ
jgi:hypothetical protein